MRLLLSLLMLTGCATQRAPMPPAPTTATIQAHAKREQVAATAAAAALERQGVALDRARTKAQNIDDKIVIILKYWD